MFDPCQNLKQSKIKKKRAIIQQAIRYRLCPSRRQEPHSFTEPKDMKSKSFIHHIFNLNFFLLIFLGRNSKHLIFVHIILVRTFQPPQWITVLGLSIIGGTKHNDSKFHFTNFPRTLKIVTVSRCPQRINYKFIKNDSLPVQDQINLIPSQNECPSFFRKFQNNIYYLMLNVVQKVEEKKGIRIEKKRGKKLPYNHNLINIQQQEIIISLSFQIQIVRPTLSCFSPTSNERNKESKSQS